MSASLINLRHAGLFFHLASEVCAQGSPVTLRLRDDPRERTHGSEALGKRFQLGPQNSRLRALQSKRFQA